MITTPEIVKVNAEAVPCSPEIKSFAALRTVERSMVVMLLAGKEVAAMMRLAAPATPPEGTTESVNVAALAVVLATTICLMMVREVAV